jgi:hypothetical protein
MKNKTTLILIICGILNTINTQAQIGGKVYGLKDDFIAMGTKPLIVELLEEKINEDDGSKESEPFVPYYNTMIKSVIGKYWKYNQEIEYKTTSEIKKLKESKSDKYMVLYYVKQNKLAIYGEAKVSSNIIIPSLFYSRIEEMDKKPDYKICMPSSGIRQDNRYLEYDFKFILVEMQAHLTWMIQNNKTVQFNEYIQLVSKDNCNKLKDKKLLTDKSLLRPKELLNKRLTEAQATLIYGNKIGFVAAEELNSFYVSNAKETAVLLNIPYGGIRPTPMEASQSMQRRVLLSYYKVIVDCETNEILWVEIPKGLVQGNTQAFLRESEFKDIAQCR